ncbi:PstS family phosphate ABC transporter substrate-binding protein, partial [Roseiflexus sp.]|uniref:PstS family phosphate ABC transporter substrate-binding protein n=2 Tax=Roseiflexus sp. TaxID=2562120 RepID=UPI00398A53F0
MRVFRVRLFAAVLALVLIVPILAACGGQQAAQPTTAPAAPTAAPAAPTTAPAAPTTAPAAPTTAPEEEINYNGLPEVDPAAVTGNIVTAGSSTVFPLTQRMAERFKDEGYTGSITIDSIGSGAGFERFCKAGETDIANASRPIRAAEVENCRAIGREPIEFRVGTDALAVVVNKENTFAQSLTKAQLAQIFSGQAKTWRDVDPAWPATPIKLFSPGSDSGTFDFFVEVVMDPAFDKKGKEAILNAPGIQLSENDNVLVAGVEGDPGAIGYFGYAYFAAERDRLNAVKVEGVEPNDQTAESGEYPLARPLFIYSDAKIMKEKPQVAAFINFYLTYVNEEVLDVGYFPASTQAINVAKSNWLAAMGVSIAMPEIDPAAVTGNVVTAGSSTVFPLTQRMAERFKDEGYTGNITIDSIGSGAGFERFCKAGETDIANASRPIRAAEVENCRAIGREPIEFRVGTDALAVVVNKENTFAQSLTKAQLAQIFSGQAKTWRDVDPAWPATPIKLFSPGSDSGTFDFFVEVVMDPAFDKKGKEAILNAPGIQLSENDNVLVAGVEGDPGAIGYFGYAYFAAERDRLNAVKVEGVEPNDQTAESGEYPLARPLFIYSDAKIMKEKPQVAAFINFY